MVPADGALVRMMVDYAPLQNMPQVCQGSFNGKRPGW